MLVLEQRGAHVLGLYRLVQRGLLLVELHEPVGHGIAQDALLDDLQQVRRGLLHLPALRLQPVEIMRVAILKRLSALGFTNRGVKRNSSFAVLRHVKRRGVSHALIETCFIDDADDMKLYKNKFYEIADAIADGVAEGFGKTVQEKEDDTVTRKEFEVIYNKVNPLYKTLSDVPDYWKAEVRKMIDCGAINGGTADNPNDVNMRYEALQAAIVAYRAAVEIHK